MCDRDCYSDFEVRGEDGPDGLTLASCSLSHIKVGVVNVLLNAIDAVENED